MSLSIRYCGTKEQQYSWIIYKDCNPIGRVSYNECKNLYTFKYSEPSNAYTITRPEVREAIKEQCNEYILEHILLDKQL